MDRRPGFEKPRLNPRLDSYRHRGAEVRIGGDSIGVAYVHPELLAAEHGCGRWKRWDRAEEHVIFWVHDGDFADYWILAEDLDKEINLWREGRATYIPEDATLHWIDDPARTDQLGRFFGVVG